MRSIFGFVFGTLSVCACCATTALAVDGNLDATTASASNALDGFVGSGICSGNVMAMGKNPGHASTGKYHGEKTLDGHWVVIHYDEDQTAANPKPYHVAQYFAYDAREKQFVSVTFDNMGESYSTGTSPGWKADTFTVDENQTTHGKTVTFRDAFTKSGDGMSSHTGTMRDKHGKWVKTDEETCHKA
ncbi:MAG: DUF1579 family protein [Rudaea sp.]